MPDILGQFSYDSLLDLLRLKEPGLALRPDEGLKPKQLPQGVFPEDIDRLRTCLARGEIASIARLCSSNEVLAGYMVSDETLCGELASSLVSGLRRFRICEVTEALKTLPPHGKALPISPQDTFETVRQYLREGGEVRLLANLIAAMQTHLSPESRASAERAVREYAVFALEEGRADGTTAALLDTFFSKDPESAPIIQAAGQKGIVKCLQMSRNDRAQWIASRCHIDTERVKEEVLATIERGLMGQASASQLFILASNCAQTFGGIKNERAKVLAPVLLTQAFEEPASANLARVVAGAGDLLYRWGVKGEQYQEPELQKLACRAAIRAGLMENSVEYYRIAERVFAFRDSCIAAAVKEEMTSAITREDFPTVKGIIGWGFKLGTIQLDADSQRRAARLVILAINEDRLELAQRIVSAAGLGSSLFQSDAAQACIEARFARKLCDCSSCRPTTNFLKKIFGLEGLNGDKIYARMTENALKRGDVESAFRIVAQMAVPAAEYDGGKLNRAAFPVLLDALEQGRTQVAANLQATFGLSNGRLKEGNRLQLCVDRVVSHLDLGHAREATTLVKALGLSDQRIGQAADRCISACLENGDFDGLCELVRDLCLDAGPLRAKVSKALLCFIEEDGWPGDGTIESLKDVFSLPERLFQTPEAKRHARIALENALESAELREALSLCRHFPIEIDDHLRSLGMRAVSMALDRGWSDDVRNFLRRFPLGLDAARENAEARNTGRAALRQAVVGFDLDGASLIQKVFAFTPEEMGDEMAIAIGEVTSSHRCQGGHAMAQAIGFPTGFPIETVLPSLSNYYRAIVSGVGLKTVEQLHSFVINNQEYCNWLVRKEKHCSLTPEIYALLRDPKKPSAGGLPLTLIEADLLQHNGYDVRAFHEAKDAQGLLHALNRVYIGKDDVCSQLSQIAARWGYGRVLEYLYRPTGVPVEDRSACIYALHYLEQRCPEVEQRVLNHTILNQVQNDGASYDRHTPQQELHSILRNNTFDVERMRCAAEEFADIEPLQKLVRQFSNGLSPFASWETLKRYNKLESALRDSRFLLELRAVKRSNPALYSYVCELYFNETSRVNRTAIIQFFYEPENFFDAKDQHAHPGLHDAIKPSRMLQGLVPYLPLKGVDLRDALVSGALDVQQAFHPMRITYQVPKSGKIYASAHEAAAAAIGKRSEGIAGLALNSGRVFKAVKDLVSEKGISVFDYLAGRVVLDDESLESRILGAVYDTEYGIPEKWIKVTATLHRKSDPRAMVVGDDTACCMPFGEGKNNVYAVDPNITLFTVQCEREDGVARTIAQSVLTRDLDINQSFAHVIQKLKARATDVADVLQQAPDMRGPFHLSCDNLQMAPNFAAQPFFEDLTRRVYADFFSEYMQRFGSKEGLESSFISIGQGSSSAIEPLPLAPNTHMPLTSPIGYCDRNDDQVRRLMVREAEKILNRKVEDLDPLAKLSSPAAAPGVSPLQATDVVPVAYLQGKLLSEAAKDPDGIQSTKITLAAIALWNQTQRKPNLSFKLTDAQGVMRGCLVAYEGVAAGRRVVVLKELLSDKQDANACRRLLNAFSEQFLRSNFLGASPDLIVHVRDAREARAMRIAIAYLARRHHLETASEEISPVKGSVPGTKAFRIALRRR